MGRMIDRRQGAARPGDLEAQVPIPPEGPPPPIPPVPPPPPGPDLPEPPIEEPPGPDQPPGTPEDEPPAGDPPAERPLRMALPPEVGGPKGPEPTRYGDWERKGRVSDF